MKKKAFTYKDEGAAVVYDKEDGSSYSAKILWVRPGHSLQLKLSPDARGHVATPVIKRRDWHRLTLFPRNSFFLVT